MDKNIFEITVAMYDKANAGGRFVLHPGWYCDNNGDIAGPFNKREEAEVGDLATIPKYDFSGLPSWAELTKKK